MATVIDVTLSKLEQEHSLRSCLVHTTLSTAEFANCLGITRETLSRMCCKRVPTPRYLLLAGLMLVYAAGKPIRVHNPVEELSTTAKKRTEVLTP